MFDTWFPLFDVFSFHFFCVLISIENFILGGVIIANSTNVRSAQKLKCGLVLAINYIGTPPIKLAIFYIKIILQCECRSDSLLVLSGALSKLILFSNVKKSKYNYKWPIRTLILYIAMYSNQKCQSILILNMHKMIL